MTGAVEESVEHGVAMHVRATPSAHSATFADGIRCALHRVDTATGTRTVLLDLESQIFNVSLQGTLHHHDPVTFRSYLKSIRGFRRHLVPC